MNRNDSILRCYLISIVAESFEGSTSSVAYADSIRMVDRSRSSGHVSSRVGGIPVGAARGGIRGLELVRD